MKMARICLGNSPFFVTIISRLEYVTCQINPIHVIAPNRYNMTAKREEESEKALPTSAKATHERFQCAAPERCSEFLYATRYMYCYASHMVLPPKEGCSVSSVKLESLDIVMNLTCKLQPT